MKEEPTGERTKNNLTPKNDTTKFFKCEAPRSPLDQPPNTHNIREFTPFSLLFPKDYKLGQGAPSHHWQARIQAYKTLYYKRAITPCPSLNCIPSLLQLRQKIAHDHPQPLWGNYPQLPNYSSYMSSIKAPCFLLIWSVLSRPN